MNQQALPSRDQGEINGQASVGRPAGKGVTSAGRRVRPVWDETIVLPGSEVGEVAAFARRRGTEWFIGVVNGQAERSLEIELAFLGEGEFQLEQLADDPAKPEGWTRSRQAVSATYKITIEMRLEGGFVARLTRL